MNDDWIDKNEMNNLISGINPKPPQQQRSVAGPVYNNDLFYDVQGSAAQQQQVQPAPQYQPQAPHQQQSYSNLPQQAYQNQPQGYQNPPPQAYQNPHQQPAPLQMQINQPHAYPQAEVSPFILDEEPTDPTERIAQLEFMLAELKQTQQPTASPPTEAPQAVENSKPTDPTEIDAEPTLPCRDRIPLTVEIDRYLSLKGRLASLAEVLREHLEMEQMMVVDQNGLSLFETRAVSAVENKVDQYLQKMRNVYAVDKDDHRNHSSSQLTTGDGKWLLLLLTDGKGIERKYTLKCILPSPLDPPEIYTLIELLNETMRPEKR